MNTKQEPKAIRKALRKQGFIEWIQDYPFVVDMKTSTKVKDGDREEIRGWFKSNVIRTHKTYGENSDVIWDKEWRRFYFKTESHLVLFKLRFL